jgi:glycosyltransferase involved in cell wall biosynthesis
MSTPFPADPSVPSVVPDAVNVPLAASAPLEAACDHDGESSATKTVRVLHLINGEHYSGAERVQDLLARQLPQFGYEVGFACVKPVRFPTARETKSAPLVELPMRGRFDLRVVGQLAKMVRDGNFALVHAHTPRTALVGRLATRQAGVPFVYHVHSPAGRDSTRRVLNTLNALVERVALRDADRIVTVSPSLKRYMLQRGVPVERVVCVPNGVPCAPAAANRTPPATTWTLGAVALFRPRKGVEVLLEALAALRSWNVDVRLRAVGGFETPAYESAVLALADRLGLDDAIDWVGFTREVNAELAQMDLFVLPSLFGEGLPMVVLEAMAAGVPVIASWVEGIPLAVRHRETGVLVHPGSVSQLRVAVEQFVSGDFDYAEMSSRARDRHAERFSDVAMARALAAVYDDLFSSRSHARGR